MNNIEKNCIYNFHVLKKINEYMQLIIRRICINGVRK